ncbi:hypothetical protein C8P63_13122 [Melghirimyces profundicolus]|uniref:Uncharacterized protein n=1 Tax=Melghirimyces profundicolus TaxID=1242148 RepID=A0A2T6B824_9BACL|nr:hypothetical protein C8P63_13122 [Melghirimyces profundicolus]
MYGGEINHRKSERQHLPKAAPAALTEHKSRLGRLRSPVSLCCPAESRHSTLRIILLRAGANAFGCNTEKLLPLNALAG